MNNSQKNTGMKSDANKLFLCIYILAIMAFTFSMKPLVNMVGKGMIQNFICMVAYAIILSFVLGYDHIYYICAKHVNYKISKEEQQFKYNKRFLRNCILITVAIIMAIYVALHFSMHTLVAAAMLFLVFAVFYVVFNAFSTVKSINK